MRVGALAFVPWYVAEVDEDAKDPRQVFHRQSGSDVEILKILCQVGKKIIRSEHNRL